MVEKLSEVARKWEEMENKINEEYLTQFYAALVNKDPEKRKQALIHVIKTIRDESFEAGEESERDNPDHGDMDERS
jgi:hypothetical protein